MPQLLISPSLVYLIFSQECKTIRILNLENNNHFCTLYSLLNAAFADMQWKVKVKNNKECQWQYDFKSYHIFLLLCQPQYHIFWSKVDLLRISKYLKVWHHDGPIIFFVNEQKNRALKSQI